MYLTLITFNFNSARIPGACLRAFEGKRLTVKAPPLPWRVMKLLEEETTKGSDLRRILAGLVCFLVYTRSRCRDATKLQSEPKVDMANDVDGYIEVQAAAVKTTRGYKKRRLGLPVAGPARGLSDSPWALPWLEARKKLYLTCDERGVLMPAKGPGHSYVDGVAMTAPQFTEILQHLLVDVGVEPSVAKRFSSHSCKATVLSWAAKYGLTLQERRLLGGHAKPGDKTPLEYSRDALAGPLHAVNGMLADIRSGRFDPDSTRSGRWSCLLYTSDAADE